MADSIHSSISGIVMISLSVLDYYDIINIPQLIHIVDTIEIPVQVNGKVRGKVVVPADADDVAIEEAARANPAVAALLGGKTVAKVVVVPGRLINFVVR